ncbi:MAG: putative 2-oxoglutarate/Fe(II)-dependent dioxygenase YbiX [Alteromonadaceae bacterium]|jgi:predicted 2-oxoglutarate/Fe(II)-dependent dioxygenase YbiX
MVSLPVISQQAQALIKLAEQAPFGRGEDTVVDTNVRNAWQISAENFELSNPKWHQALQVAVDQVGTKLGLQGVKINVEQYKLLIYEKDSFFIPHRDTEKTANMFATLVVNLPSEHEGGELVVSHGGQSQRYSFADIDAFYPEFVAFYADCEHEIKPVTAGFRIGLIYNLAIANRKRQPLLSEQLKGVESVNQLLQKWSVKNDETPHITYLLSHDYSDKNLCLANLKNGDFAKATVLLEAAQKSDCRAFLCLVTYIRQSYGDMAYSGRYSRYDNEHEDNFEEHDVEREAIYAHGFMTVQGEKLTIKALSLEEDELLADISLFDGPGGGMSISEATGNAGATKDLWYHRGAVILWPKDREFDMVEKMDIDYATAYFIQCTQDKTKVDDEYWRRVKKLAAHVVANMSLTSDKDIAASLITLGDVALAKQLVQRRLSDYDMSKVKVASLTKLANFFGWQSFNQDIFASLTSKRDALNWITKLLAVDGVSSEGQSIITQWVIALWRPSLESHLNKNEISVVIQLLTMLNMQGTVDEVIAFLLTQRKPLFVLTKYGPAVKSALAALKDRGYDQQFNKKFIVDVHQRIQTAFPVAPTKPANWLRAGKLKCNCQFCGQVNKFLTQPERSELLFQRVLKREMTHVESEINLSGVDLDIVISHYSTKFKGVCQKNLNGYDHQLQLFECAQNLVKALPL